MTNTEYTTRKNEILQRLMTATDDLGDNGINIANTRLKYEGVIKEASQAIDKLFLSSIDNLPQPRPLTGEHDSNLFRKGRNQGLQEAKDYLRSVITGDKG